MYFISDGYLGLDQQYDIPLKVVADPDARHADGSEERPPENVAALYHDKKQDFPVEDDRAAAAQAAFS